MWIDTNAANINPINLVEKYLLKYEIRMYILDLCALIRHLSKVLIKRTSHGQCHEINEIQREGNFMDS